MTMTTTMMMMTMSASSLQPTALRVRYCCAAAHGYDSLHSMRGSTSSSSEYQDSHHQAGRIARRWRQQRAGQAFWAAAVAVYQRSSERGVERFTCHNQSIARCHAGQENINPRQATARTHTHTHTTRQQRTCDRTTLLHTARSLLSPPKKKKKKKNTHTQKAQQSSLSSRRMWIGMRTHTHTSRRSLALVQPRWITPTAIIRSMAPPSLERKRSKVQILE